MATVISTEACDKFGFFVGQKSAKIFFEIMSFDVAETLKQGDKAFAKIKEGLEMLGKFDSPQASLKTCLKQMNKDFLKYLDVLYNHLLKKTTLEFKDPWAIFSNFLYNNYGNFLKNVKNDYVIIDNAEDFNLNKLIDGPNMHTINNIILDYANSKTQVNYEQLLLHKQDEVLNFLKKFGIGYDDLIAPMSTRLETKNLLKNFFNNIMSNDYSYLNSILNTMNPKDKQHISILMNNLIDTLETELIGIETVLLQADLNVFNTFASIVSKKFDAVITKWCNDNFSANYHWLSNLELQKINEILSDNTNLVSYATFELDDIFDNLYSNHVETSLRDFFIYFFQLIDENENIIDLTKQIPNNIKLRLNMKRLTVTNGDVDNRFYGFIYTLAKSTLLQQETIEQNGGSHLHFSLLDRLRNEIMISNNKILFNRLVNYSDKIYAIYDLFFDFFIGYDPNNFIHTFLKSHYSSKRLQNCSPGLQSVVLSHNVPCYIPVMGGNAINHGALIQGIMEQLGGNNLAYDMYLSDTTLQLHNNELEHSVMSDIMRGGNQLDLTFFNSVDGNVYFNKTESINELYCLLDSLLKDFNLSQPTMDNIHKLFKDNMEADVKIMRLIDIIKKMKDVDQSEYGKEEDKYFKDGPNKNTSDFESLLKEISNLKKKQNSNTATAQNATTILAIVEKGFVTSSP